MLKTAVSAMIIIVVIDLNSVLLGLLFAQVIVDLRHLSLDGEHLACDYSRSFEFHGVDVFDQ